MAAVRKLAVRLYWMLRQNVGYPEIARIESSPRVPLVGLGQTELWSSAPLATQAVLTHRPGFVWPESCLTKPSSLSRGTLRVGEGKIVKVEWMGHPPC